MVKFKKLLRKRIDTQLLKGNMSGYSSTIEEIVDIQVPLRLKIKCPNCVLSGAKLISPVIMDTFTAGYNWCVDTIKMSTHSEVIINISNTPSSKYQIN